MDQNDPQKTKRKSGEDPVAAGMSSSSVDESDRSQAQRERLAHLFEEEQGDGGKRGGRRRRKAKRGSSRTARRFEDIERRISRAVRRVTKAVNRGMAEYQDRRDKVGIEAAGWRVGRLPQNVAEGASRAISETSPVLVDLSKAFNTRRNRRRIRRSLRKLPRIPFLV